jgi:hypothetical protein
VTVRDCSRAHATWYGSRLALKNSAWQRHFPAAVTIDLLGVIEGEFVDA